MSESSEQEDQFSEEIRRVGNVDVALPQLGPLRADEPQRLLQLRLARVTTDAALTPLASGSQRMSNPRSPEEESDSEPHSLVYVTWLSGTDACSSEPSGSTRVRACTRHPMLRNDIPVADSSGLAAASDEGLPRGPLRNSSPAFTRQTQCGSLRA